MKSHGRIDFLDGLRGVAILAVAGYHAFARWPDLYPYRDAFASFPLFRFGWIGVYLFFLISGFVITMTLERGAGFGEYLFRRWLRLFPAMLIATALIYATAFAFPERPYGLPALRDILPGLTFIDPHWWAYGLDPAQRDLEGAFWSLYVEVKFYVLFGVLFFALSERAALIGLALVAVAGSRLLGYLGDQSVAAEYIHQAGLGLGGRYFGWFLLGALARRAFVERSCRAWALVALASPLAIGWFKGPNLVPVFAALALFFVALASPLAQRPLRGRALLFFGFISYPLYLIHENMLVASIVKIGATGGVLALLSPAPGFVLLAAIAFAIAKWGEPALRSGLVRLFRSFVLRAPRVG